VAIYRIAYEGWNQGAGDGRDDQRRLGFHPMWQNLRRYIDAAGRRRHQGAGGEAGTLAIVARPTPNVGGPRFPRTLLL